MYKGTQFRIRPVADILEDLSAAFEYYGEGIKTMFFPDGNTILMKTDQLITILEEARRLFPALERITVYGSARYINLKTEADLDRLKAAGLNRIHSGMESGDDAVLAKIQKGAIAGEIVEAGRKVKQAGIELSEYVLIGAGGRELTREHATGSAAVLNSIDPDFIRVRTLVPIPGTPLYEDYRQGKFTLLRPYEALEETRLLIESLTCRSMFYSDHYSNYAYVNGRLPDDKPAMLQTVAKLFQVPEDQFRPPAEGGL
jgi:radical SAM superfamily enzyme YgiQ (UPF0313 family)